MTDSTAETLGETPTSDSKKRHKLGLWLSIIFVAALILGPGPGILLVNSPKPILGLPAVYAWGLLWYVVEVGVVIAFYRCVWRSDDGEVAN
ncbi:MAG: hypothetical protein CMJ78_25565 [Planctomycetaceae bacterium]|nr:hypothetical protein [Planctomycetaceae bacterium]